MRRFKRFAAALALVIVPTAFFLLGASRAVQHEPSFYAEALAVPAERHLEAGDELERSVLELHNEAERDGRWEAAFTEEQVNGWLAFHLTESFREWLPPGVQDPRVDLQRDRLRLAFRYAGGRVPAVIDLEIEPYMAEGPNELAVRVHHVRAGRVPLPQGQMKEQVTQAAMRAGWPLRWITTDETVTAVVRLPLHRDSRQPMFLDLVEVREGVLIVAGRTQTIGVEEGNARELEGDEAKDAGPPVENPQSPPVDHASGGKRVSDGERWVAN